jgi:hypothetical protein
MASSEPPCKRTKVVIEQFLTDIRKLIDYLPDDLPEPSVSRYDFSDITAAELEDYGTEPCCVTRWLETELGHLSPDSQHRLQFKERGAGAASAVDFLDKYYHKHPGDIMIQNWITGLLAHLKITSRAELDDSDTNDLGIKVSFR